MGNVKDLISVCVGSGENQNTSSSQEMNFNCASNFQDANSNEIVDLHTVERVSNSEEQVDSPNEETRALAHGTPLVFARVNTQEGEFINREIDTRDKEKTYK